MVWDRGRYAVEGGKPEASLRDGKMKITLEGNKAKGEWSLVRTRMNAAKPQWLLIKTGATVRAISKKRDDESVVSGRTMKQIAAERGAEWESGRKRKKKGD